MKVDRGEQKINKIYKNVIVDVKKKKNDWIYLSKVRVEMW